MFLILHVSFSIVIIGVLIYKYRHYVTKYLEYKDHCIYLEKSNKTLETQNLQYKAILRQIKEDIESVERL